MNDDHVRGEADGFQGETSHTFGVGTAKSIFKMYIPALYPAGL